MGMKTEATVRRAKELKRVGDSILAENANDDWGRYLVFRACVVALGLEDSVATETPKA